MAALEQPSSEDDGAAVAAAGSHTLEDDGSGQVVVAETPDLLVSSLTSLRATLGSKLRHEGDGDRDEVLLRFLRCSKFDVPNAADRYGSHWDFREERGYGSAPFSHAALPPEVQRGLALGFMQPTAARDKCGRQVLLAFPPRLDYTILDENILCHIVWYIMDIVLRDEETQVW